MIIDLIAGFIFTWVIGLTPAYILRYKIFKKPLKKRFAIPLAGTFWIIQLIIATAIQESLGISNSQHSALNLVALASFYIMVKKT